MADEFTDNLKLTKISRRKAWAEAMNENLDKIGALHYYHTDGWMFICKNAICNDGIWTQPNPILQSSVIALGNDGSFTLQTCPAGNSPINSWTQIASFGSDGSLTLSSGSNIGSDGSLTLSSGSNIRSDGSLTLPGGATISGAASIGGGLNVAGNLSVTGSITGNLAAYLLLSQIAIDSNKDWNGKSITNLNKIAVNYMKASAGTTVRKTDSNTYQITVSEYGDSGFITKARYVVPDGYVPVHLGPPATPNVFTVTYEGWTNDPAIQMEAYIVIIRDGREVSGGGGGTTITNTTHLTRTFTVSCYAGDVLELRMLVRAGGGGNNRIGYLTNIQIKSDDTVQQVQIGSDGIPTWT
jgi:hypothetical protein